MLKLVALVLPLGLDTFAVCAALGVAGLPASRRLRIAALFTAFEATMPLIGLAVGTGISHALRDASDDAAIALLIGLGLYMALAPEEDEEERLARLAGLGGWRSLGLGLSVSLDELAIGFTFGLLRVPVVPALALIAGQAFLVALLGLKLGARVGERIREGAERIAGVALALLGLGLLVERLVS